MPLPQDDIELGAAGAELRLWRAREAMRQGELSLHSLAETRDNLRAAATSLLGWSVTGIGVVSAAALTAPRPEWRHAASLAILALLVVAFLCVVSLFPRRWAKPGYIPTIVLKSNLSSELEITEALAQRIASDIRENLSQLDWISVIVRIAWVAFAATPALGLLALTGWGERLSAGLLGAGR